MNAFIQNSGSFEGTQFQSNGSGTIGGGTTNAQFRRQAPIRAQGSGSKSNSNQINQRRILKQKEAGPVKTKNLKSSTKDDGVGP